jgi:hypothetical protein
MKQINIEKKYGITNPLIVSLGNGNKVKFSSKRQRGYFVADTNRFLTKCLVIINETLIDCYTEYRRAWLLGANTNAGTKSYYLNELKEIQKGIIFCEQMMEKFNNTCSGSNDPFFSFIDLRKAATFLQGTADQLEQWHKKRNNTANKYICEILRDRCMLINHRLQNYGTENEHE